MDMLELCLNPKVKEEGLEKNNQAFSLQHRLAPLLAPARLVLTITNNQSTMISVRRNTCQYAVRLHRVFLQADGDIVHHLATFIKAPRPTAVRALRAYVHHCSENQLIPPHKKTQRNVAFRTMGTFHNLSQIYTALNERYFQNQIKADITWGRHVPTKRKRRSVRLGSYSIEDRVIRIHPLLDQDFVPNYMVAWIVYHEMLHQKHEVRTLRGRRRFHPPEFVAEERLFEDYERVKEWERKYLHKFLRG